MSLILLALSNYSKFIQEVASGTVTNADVSYLATVTFGTNSFSLIVDTGSSNTWAGAQGGYSPGSTGVKSGGTVSVSYGSVCNIFLPFPREKA